MGIGTTNPGSKLDLGNNVNNLIHVGGSGTDSYIAPNYWDTYGTDFSFNTHNAYNIIFNPQGTGNSIFANGNVGIGTPAPNQQLEITKNFRLPSTAGTTPYGIIYKDTTPFIHDFNYGNNGTVTTAGGNTFVGLNAGNFTMGSTANQTYHASYNTGIGCNSLYSNTTGSSNTASGCESLYSNTIGSNNIANGYQSLYFNTEGSCNTANGYQSLYFNTEGSCNTANGYQSLYFNTIGSNNTASGFLSLFLNTEGNFNTANGFVSLFSNVTGSNNTANGYNSLTSNVTGSNNTANGAYSLSNNITGSNNTALGYNSGLYIADGTTGNNTGNNGIYLGCDSKASADGTNNEIVIGYNAIGKGSNTIQLGNTSILRTYAKGLNLEAGTATAGTAPIKLTSGINLTTPESGAIEFSSSRLYFTPSSTRETVAFLSDITSASHVPVTIGSIGSTPNANGMSISGQTLSLQPASATYGGVITTGTQTLAGAKTLSSLLTASAGIANNGSYTQTGTSENTFTGITNINNAISYNYRNFTAGGDSNNGIGRWSKLATFQTTGQYNNDKYEILLRSRNYAGKLYVVINSNSSVTTNLVDFRFISDFICENVPDIQIYRSQDSSYLSTWDVYIYNTPYSSYEYAENNTRSHNGGGNGKVVTFYQYTYEDPPVGSIAVSYGPYFNGIVSATGITSSGTINFSSLTASKVVFTDGSKNLTSTGIGTASQFIKGDGSLDSNTYLTSGSISGFVPYTGATSNVDLGTRDLYCNEISAASKLTVGNTNTGMYSDGGLFRIVTPSTGYAQLYFYSIDTADEFGVVQIYADPEEGISFGARTNDNSWNSSLRIGTLNLGLYTNSLKRLEIVQNGSINAFGNTITSTGGFIGNASTATKLQTARTITIGNQSLSFDGTQNLTYSLNDIGYSQTRIGSNTYSYLSGDIILQGSGKIFINQMGQFITVNSYGYTKEDVGLGNVTNNAQWHNGNHPTTLAGYGITDIVWSSNYHPTTIAGYGITDALTISGLATNNIPKWNGTTFVNGPLTTNASGTTISTNAYFVSNIGVSAPIIAISNNNTGLGQSYMIYDRFTENSIKLIGAGYDEGYISILPENDDGLNVMVGSMSGARNLYVTGGTSTSSISLRNGAVTGYYLKCINTNGVAEWSPVTASQIYKGTWNASTNTPYLSNGSGTAGWYYRVTTAGTFNSVTYSIGDDIIYNGSIWERIPGAGYSLQTATTTILGGVKIDGTSVKLNASNQLYVSTNYEAPLTFTNGLSRTGNTVSFSVGLSGFVPYEGATQDVDLGSKRLTADNICVTAGSGTGKVLMDVTGQGHAAWMTISSLPVASSTVIGGIKVGYGLQIDAAVLSVNPGVFVPYTGADRDVNLASYSIYAYDFLIYSDINLKCNIEDIEMKKLDINYKQFEYKTSRGKKRYGVIAQELLSIAPEFVSESNNSYAVKYTDLLIYEVAQLKEEVKQLKSLLCR